MTSRATMDTMANIVAAAASTVIVKKKLRPTLAHSKP